MFILSSTPSFIALVQEGVTISSCTPSDEWSLVKTEWMMGGRRLRYFDSMLGRSKTMSLYTEPEGSVFCSVKVDVDDEATAKRSLVNRSIGARIYPSPATQNQHRFFFLCSKHEFNVVRLTSGRNKHLSYFPLISSFSCSCGESCTVPNRGKENVGQRIGHSFDSWKDGGFIRSVCGIFVVIVRW